MRDLTRLIATAAGHGADIGIYAERLLDHQLPWTRMRQVYRLLGLVKRYGATPVDTACGRALELDVVSVLIPGQQAQAAVLGGGAARQSEAARQVDLM